MFKISPAKKLLSYFVIIFALNSCAKEGFFKGGDARKISPDPRERVKKNLEEGRGFRLNDIGKKGNTNFEFASSNALLRSISKAIIMGLLINSLILIFIVEI